MLKRLTSPLLLKICCVALCCQSIALAEDKWQESKSAHFVIYYKEAPSDFVATVEEMAEGYFDKISDNMGIRYRNSWSFDKRAQIYIYDNQKDYLASPSSLGWSSGITTPQQKMIRTFPAAHGFFDTTLPHELGHIIFREAVGFKAQVPLWFEEGIAMYQEQARRWGAHDTIRDAIDNKTFKTLKELSSVRPDNKTDPKTVELFYAESASIVNYMIGELGEYRFRNFCDALAKDTPFEWALHQVYSRFDTIDDLNKSWMSFLQEKHE